jgi:hypothetical protein
MESLDAHTHHIIPLEQAYAAVVGAFLHPQQVFCNEFQQ